MTVPVIRGILAPWFLLLILAITALPNGLRIASQRGTLERQGTFQTAVHRSSQKYATPKTVGPACDVITVPVLFVYSSSN